MVGWRPADIDEYNIQLQQQQLLDIRRAFELESKTEEIQHGLSVLEATVRKSAEACKATRETTTSKDVLTTGTRDLIT